MTDSPSKFPKQEVIIDPLYEPLQLNRYELCSHLKMLSNVSHLRYGISPYLLFDAVKMKNIFNVLKDQMKLEVNNKDIDDFQNSYDALENKIRIYINSLEQLGTIRYISWNQISNPNNQFIDFLQLKFGIDLKNKNLKPTNDGNTITIKSGDKSISISLKCDENNVILTINDDKKDKFAAKKEDGQINIYYHYNRNTCIKRLIKERKNIIASYKEIKKYFNSVSMKKKDDQINIYDQDILLENFDLLYRFFQLQHPIQVKCPKCGEKQFMCEEGKIYSMKEALLRTFELRRARWLQMSALLHTVHSTSTHTRLSHQIGSMIVGVNALKEMDVYPSGDMQMLLGEYLLLKGNLHEFLLANFLHDIGHSPLSHVMEPNPFIKLDHEKITRNLILGRKPDEEKGMDWYVAERYLLKTKAIKDFEYRFFENRYDSVYDLCEEEEGKPRETKFLDCLKNNDKILESEIITITEVLNNFGVDKKLLDKILTGNDKSIQDTQFLHKLIHSEIDFDRIDHVKRDSVVCGLSLSSFRLLELLGSMSVVLPYSDVHEMIYNSDSNKPYILISEDGVRYVMDLLIARRSVFNDILYSDENNWINGVVNQITAQTMKYLPHLEIMLPFITDQILMQFYANDLFIGTQIEKLNKLFHGKIDCSGYGEPTRYKLKDKKKVANHELEEMYNVIRKINNKFDRIDAIPIVFYTNIEEIDEEVKEKEWDDIFIYKKEFCGEYYPFQVLVKKNQIERTTGEIFREIFPEIPSELDVKNLFYFWICDSMVSDEKNNKKKCIEYIEKKIGVIWSKPNESAKKAFKERFINLDEIPEEIK